MTKANPGVIQFRREAIQSRESMAHELVGVRTHAMRNSHAVLLVSAARSRWSILAKLNSNVCGFRNGVHTEDLLIARSMTTCWACDASHSGLCKLSASEAAPAIKVGGPSFTQVRNATFMMGTTLLSASEKESWEDM